MYIESVQLKNFRNYKNLELYLDPGTNIFYGDNAQGKTNILESVYLCGTTKSHRSSKDREMIRFEQEEAHIRMAIKKNTLSYRIDMHLKKNKSKGIAINAQPIRKAKELFGVINLVFFSPEDLHIIKNGPAQRRRFIDLELCQLDSVYLSDLTSYHQVLNHRNRLLKDLSFNTNLLEMLNIWDLQMIRYGKKIISKRAAFIQELNEIASEVHKNLTGGKEYLEILYEPDTKEEDLEENLQKNREKDKIRKLTSIGPHRDDLNFMINGMDIRKYGSQGQQRTAALSLKLSEISLVKKKVKDTPVLLLDDVLSELDSHRQNYLLECLQDIQTLVTCTGLDDFIAHQFQINKVFKVINGEVCSPCV